VNAVKPPKTRANVEEENDGSDDGDRVARPRQKPPTKAQMMVDEEVDGENGDDKVGGVVEENGVVACSWLRAIPSLCTG